jgi:hypothetical protein
LATMLVGDAGKMGVAIIVLEGPVGVIGKECDSDKHCAVWRRQVM